MGQEYPPAVLHGQATYLCDTVKPQMAQLRAAVDKAENLQLGQSGESGGGSIMGH